jgi:drug/metabolite transporter (DMT)-like permease
MRRIFSVPRSSRVTLIAAFTAVYLIWGSTYLAIRFAVSTLPPFLMASTRFLIAGGLVYIWARSRGVARPSFANWRAALVVGTLLLLGGNGIVAKAEQTVPSSITALLISITPLWMTLIDWLRPGGNRPSPVVIIGLLIGFGGVALLIAPDITTVHNAINPIGLLVIPIASLCWAAGSIYAREASMPSSPLMGTGLEMLAGGAVLLVAGLVTGEPAQLHLDHTSWQSAVALVYLIIFGSLIAFTAYVWILRNTPLALASTYAYVNPVVAVFLGWLLAGEKLTIITVIASAIIVGSVIIITTFRSQPAQHSQQQEQQEDDLAIATRK